MKGFLGTNRSKLLSPFSIMAWILIALMMFSSLTSVIAETSEGNKATTMVFIIDSSTYVVNGEPIVMDVSPAIIENRTMLPIRYAAEPLGADIEWD
ncbi:MAG TPA: copper amine oxidase N-terminal domain-containing protein, partial [Anaerovoracaceae bacterium]|nr:copper amine oxidase N-terminal domain-containing protein [Anaerovoracaceae bacterium]